MPNRIGGASRYETAALLADEFVALTGTAPRAVVLASGEDAKQGIDALSATFLAGVLGAPVLLTARETLPEPTREALARLGAPDVRVMGGPGVVSDAVLAALGAGGAAVSRVSGTDRYDTAATAARLGADAIASYALMEGVGSRRTALLASGTNPADGLSAGPLAYAARVPLLLTSRDQLPAPTAAAVRDLGIGQVVALGGSAAISPAVLAALDAAGVAVLTAAGASRFDTAAILLALASCPQLGPDAAAGEGSAVGGFGLAFADAAQGYLANGERFPDALAAGPVAGAALRPLFLTGATTLAAETAGVIGATAARSMTAVGLAGAVNDAVLAAA